MIFESDKKKFVSKDGRNISSICVRSAVSDSFFPSAIFDCAYELRDGMFDEYRMVLVGVKYEENEEENEDL